MDRARLIAIGQCIGVLLLMSYGAILMKIALFEMDPITFAWVTVGIAMIVMSVYTFGFRRERIPKGLGKQVWYYIIMIGLCNFTISKLSRPFAMERLPVVTVSYVGNFIGFITMGMSIFILNEIPTIFQLVGALIAFIGIRIFFLVGPTSYEFIGILYILIGIVAVAYTNNIARKLAIVTQYQLSNNIISTLALLIGGLVTLGVGLVTDWPPQIHGWKNWGIIFYTAIVSIALGLTVWNNILRTLRSYEASILGASTIIWTTIMAVIILGETLTPYKIVGMVFMVLGLILVQVRKGRLDVFINRVRKRFSSAASM
jgi:O-acetylserine/cysteine efflux transporter